MNPDLPNPRAMEAAAVKLQAKVFLLWVFGFDESSLCSSVGSLGIVFFHGSSSCSFFNFFRSSSFVWSSISLESQIHRVL
nr:hypothetical protein CFP56_04719 [Quercus suber]